MMENAGTECYSWSTPLLVLLPGVHSTAVQSDLYQWYSSVRQYACLLSIFNHKIECIRKVIMAKASPAIHMLMFLNIISNKYKLFY